MKLEVGMYVRGKYYQYRGKIGEIIKNYNNDLEIAYKDGILKTNVGSFIDDNYDINGKQYKASYNIIDLIEVGDYVNGRKVVDIFYDANDNAMEVCVLGSIEYDNNEIKSVITHEQMEQMAYKVGE